MGGAHPVTVGDSGQPLHVHTQEPGEHLGLGLAQLRELGGDVADRAVVLTDLVARADRLHRRSVSLGVERRGERPCGCRHGVEAVGTGTRGGDHTAGPVHREGADGGLAPGGMQKPQGCGGEVVIGVREAFAARVGQREGLGRTAAPPGARRLVLASGDPVVGEQAVEVPTDGGRAEAQARSERCGGLRAVLEQAGDDGVAGADRVRFPVEAYVDFHNTSVSYFRIGWQPGAGVSTVTPRRGVAAGATAAAYSPEVADTPARAPEPGRVPASGNAVELIGLHKSYGDLRAVDGLSLSARRGSVLALLGPNGAGKTTTVDICAGFRRADGGEVRVLGLDPARDSRALKPRVGVMPQGGGAYPGARAGEMLRLVASYSARPLDPDDLLDRLGLRSSARTTYRRLSGGQQQRLSLAMAIVGRPELVFLDEPTAGLDPQARHATWEVVASLRADGVAVVLTTHYMDEAERLADRVVVIDHGQVVASGSPSELTRETARRQLRFSVPDRLRVADLAADLPADATATEVRPGDYLVEGAVGPELVALVASWCAHRGLLVTDLQVQRRSLEDVFLELTGRELRS